MRSELVFGAKINVSNRFLLTKAVAKATRRLHRPNTRIQETVNEVFQRFRRADPLAAAPYTGNLQQFHRSAQDEPRSFCEDVEQSVA